MFARRVIMKLKPDTATEFAKRLETNVIPVLRKQKGFQEELVFVEPTGNEALAISLWGGKENADAYTRSINPELVKKLDKIVDGIPQVRTYEVLTSMLPKNPVGVTA